MESREIVHRAIEFETPPRLPFFLGGAWGKKLPDLIEGFPNDVCDCWEMDRQESGWFFDHVAPDDWGTQNSTFVSAGIFKEFFFDRYKALFDAIHGHGWHVFLHSCGRVNDFVPLFIDVGVDVLNMQQPQAYGLKEFGEAFAGKVCFLTTVDIQATLPKEDPEAVRAEARELTETWSTPKGGLIVFNYGDSESIGVKDAIAEVMFKEFYDLREYWTAKSS